VTLLIGVQACKQKEEATEVVSEETEVVDPAAEVVVDVPTEPVDSKGLIPPVDPSKVAE
jgi:hypothetical protein